MRFWQALLVQLLAFTLKEQQRAKVPVGFQYSGIENYQPTCCVEPEPCPPIPDYTTTFHLLYLVIAALLVVVLILVVAILGLSRPVQPVEASRTTVDTRVFACQTVLDKEIPCVEAKVLPTTAAVEKTPPAVEVLSQGPRRPSDLQALQ